MTQMRTETIDQVTHSPLACLPLLLFCFERRRGVQRQTSNFTLLTITSLNSIAAEESGGREVETTGSADEIGLSPSLSSISPRDIWSDISETPQV